jgi:hypothetical protein
MGWLLALAMQLPSVERIEKLIRKGKQQSSTLVLFPCARSYAQ